MPPRKSQVAASPARSVGNGRLTAPSPARSTRSTRSIKKGDEEEWDGESMDSRSFKVPTSKGLKTSANLSLNDTSVKSVVPCYSSTLHRLTKDSSVAAAFHAARNGHSLPTPTSTHSRPSTSSARPQAQKRAQSPAEQIASAARALSPVRYFLRPGKDEEGDGSGEYNSFASFGDGNGTGNGNGSVEHSYDYQQEEDYVKAVQAKSRITTSKVRKEELPYRPVEESDDSDSGGEGEGIVKGGGLEGRSELRGKRKEKGEGYLGMGLGLQPRPKRKGRKSGDMAESEEEEPREDYPPRSLSPYVELPVPSRPNSRARSTTPAQFIRAFSPRLSPAPPTSYKRRQPSSLRTVITNILHGIALSLSFAYDLFSHLASAVLLRPLKAVVKSSKTLIRRAKQDWLKWLGGLLALSLALKLLDRPWRSTQYTAPTVPPSSMDELVARLTSLEHALSVLSIASKVNSEASEEGRRNTQVIQSKMDDLEENVSKERKRIEAVRGDGARGVQNLKESVETIKAEMGDLVGRVGGQEKSLASMQGVIGNIDSVDREVRLLKERLGQVEQGVRDALDDGRLRTVLENILPHSMPVRRSLQGGLDIDPTFWSEMKKVLVEKNDVERIVKRLVGAENHKSSAGGADLTQLQQWADGIFEKKVSSGVFVTRADFLDILENEVSSLRTLMEERPVKSIPVSAPPPRASSITIKSSKGDDLTSLFQSLIDAALLRYSKDTIARPDFALFSSGGRVVPSITSDTLVMHSPSTFGRLVLGKKDVEGRSPATALHPDNSVGSCWPFRGGMGQLGILLSRRVRVSDVTLEHAALDLALDVSSAPKVVEVWGLIDGEENRSKVEQFLSSTPQEQTSSMASTSDHLLLATITYDPTSASHIQTFPVDPDIVALGVDVGIVIFKIQSNWGGDLTCMYRVRVHGEAVEGIEGDL